MISGTFRLLTLVLLAMKKQLLAYLKSIQIILITFKDGSQVSDCWPYGYFLHAVLSNDPLSICLVCFQFLYCFHVDISLRLGS